MVALHYTRSCTLHGGLGAVPVMASRVKRRRIEPTALEARTVALASAHEPLRTRETMIGVIAALAHHGQLRTLFSFLSISELHTMKVVLPASTDVIQAAVLDNIIASIGRL